MVLPYILTEPRAAPSGEILTHMDPALIGTDIEDLLGPAVRDATAEGGWITADDNPARAGPQTMRFWVIDVDGILIGRLVQQRDQLMQCLRSDGFADTEGTAHRANIDAGVRQGLTQWKGL